MNLTGHALVRGCGAPLALAIVIGGTLGAGPHDALMLVANAGAPSGSADRGASGDEGAFLAESEAAMAKMMADDMTATPTGDVDRDFVLMMAPHHQGAIDMALAELRYGHNELLRRIAQEIIVTHQQEIAAMHLAADQPLPASAPAPTTPAPFAATPSPMSHDAMAMPARPRHMS